MEAIQQIGGDIYNYGAQAANTAGTYVNDYTTAANEPQPAISNNTIAGSFAALIDSTSWTAYLTFLLFVTVVMYLLLYLTIYGIGYFRVARQAPWLISGTLPGTTTVTVVQHPYQNPTKFIARSDDDPNGMSFTYSWWLQVDAPRDTSGTVFYPVFLKGRLETLPKDGKKIAEDNAPGVYVVGGTQDASLNLYFDAEGNEDKTQPRVVLKHIPLRKWMHVVLRLQNTAMDVYVNGTIAQRVVFANVPKQNDFDLHVCPNGGFAGSIADLRYYPSALSAFAIHAISLAGPNTRASVHAPQATVKGSETDYLAAAWYESTIN